MRGQMGGQYLSPRLAHVGGSTTLTDGTYPICRRETPSKWIRMEVQERSEALPCGKRGNRPHETRFLFAVCGRQKPQSQCDCLAGGLDDECSRIITAENMY